MLVAPLPSGLLAPFGTGGITAYLRRTRDAGGGGGGGITVVAHTSSIGDPNGTTTGAIDTTGADLIIVGASFFSNPTVADSKGNTWTALTLYNDANGSARLYYTKPSSVGSGHTFSATGGTTYAGLFVLAVSGSNAAPFDVENGNGTYAASPQPGSVTPSVNGSLVVTMLGMTGSSAAIGSGFTIADQRAYAAGNNYGGALAYLVQGAAAAINPTWTVTGGSGNAAIASFKPV